MKRWFIIGLFVMLALAACHSPQRKIPPQEDILYQVEGFYTSNFDSALIILDTLNVSLLSEKEKAHYCLLMVILRDHYFLYDSLTDSLMYVAENYFVDSKERWFEATTCEALSRVAFKKGEGEQIKLDWLQKAVESIDQCAHVDERLIRFSSHPMSEQNYIGSYKYKLHMRLGMCYSDNGYVEEGRKYMKQAYQYYADNQNERWLALSANMLGTSYLSCKEYDSCRSFFEKGLEAAQRFNQIDNIVYYHYSMSMLYTDQFDNKHYEDEEEGRQLLQKAIAECHQGLTLSDKGMTLSEVPKTLTIYKEGFYCYLGRLYFRLEHYDSCSYYVEKQIDYMNAIHHEIVPHIENAALFYRLYKSYEALGDKEKALKYANRYIEMQRQLENQPKAVEQVKNEYDKKLEMMQLEKEQQSERYKHYLLLTLALAVLVVVLWLSNRYRKNKEIEVLRQEKAYRKLQVEFEEASQRAQQSHLALQQRMMEIYKSGEENKLERILSEFSAVYPRAMKKLSTGYPELNESERNIVVLSFLGFRTKEEAEILGLSLNTVEKYRTNIRKKAKNKPFSDLIG